MSKGRTPQKETTVELMFDRERTPPQWETSKVFSQQVGRTVLAIEVQQNKAVKWPAFSWNVGRLNDDGRVIHFVGFEMPRGDNDGRRYIEYADVMRDLMVQAQTWVKEETTRLDIESPPPPRRTFTPNDRPNNGGGYGGGGYGGGGGGGYGADRSNKTVMRKGKTARSKARRHGDFNSD